MEQDVRHVENSRLQTKEMFFKSKAQDRQRIIVSDYMAGKDALDVCPVEVPEVWIIGNIEIVIPVYKVIARRTDKSDDRKCQYSHQWQPLGFPDPKL